jgi:hypothetical protein
LSDKCELVVQAKENAHKNLFKKYELKRLYRRSTSVYELNIKIDVCWTNSIEEEIKGRISLGNKTFYANQDLFKSKLLTKNSKLRMYEYKTLVRLVVTYACETWVLKENIKGDESSSTTIILSK